MRALEKWCVTKVAHCIKSMQAGTRSQLQLAAVCSKQAATKSEKSNLHTKNTQAARLQQTMSRKVAATKSSKVAARNNVVTQPGPQLPVRKRIAIL